ncbi:MAG: hypothetical protein H6673_08785 [Anaerolineales bacterium]|nr:hypothetical protein [Anaerolineales bacterium]
MAFFLESARADEARASQKLGFVSGILTNPDLMRQLDKPTLDTLEELVEIVDGHVFYHLTAPTLEGRIDEAWQAYDLRPDRVVVKLAATTENLRFMSRVSEIDVAITSVFSPLQGYAAAEAGADYVIVHFNRADKLLNGQGLNLIADMVQLLARFDVEVLAGEIQTAEQALQILQLGVHHVALPFDILCKVGDHPLTERVLQEMDPT